MDTAKALKKIWGLYFVIVYFLKVEDVDLMARAIKKRISHFG